MKLCVLLAMVIAAIGWIKWLMQYISALTLVWYLTEKDFPLPSDEDMKQGSRYVVSHLFTDLCSGKH